MNAYEHDLADALTHIATAIRDLESVRDDDSEALGLSSAHDDLAQRMRITITTLDLARQSISQALHPLRRMSIDEQQTSRDDTLIMGVNPPQEPGEHSGHAHRALGPGWGLECIK